MHYYQIYGVTVISEIELPALIISQSEDTSSPPIYVKLGNVPAELSSPEWGKTFYSVFNENECLTSIPNIASYYTTDGNRIVVEPISVNIEEVALFIYSTCFAVVFIQRNILLMHVSGCFIAERKVLLLAAPSGTGKSTTAAMLSQKGYYTFTDDTALLYIENGRCYARASYPETRIWKDVAEIQQVYDETEGRRVTQKIDKFAFSFASSFITEEVAVVGIVFIEASGDKIKVNRLSGAEIWQLLNANVYGTRFVEGMKKGRLRFSYLSSLANTLPAWKATRPETARSFEEFSKAIEDLVIKKLTGKKKNNEN